VKTLLLLLLLFFTPLFAEDGVAGVKNSDVETTIETAPKAKVLYLSYETLPQRVLKGEIFSITLKVLSTVGGANEIEYKFTDYTGLKPLNLVPNRVKQSNYYFDTFYFLTTQIQAKIPNIEASIVGSSKYASTTLAGNPLNVVALNPKKDFSNILANSFELVDYKTTSYDNKHNIIVFVAKANNAELGAMKFSNVFKQGVESLQDSYFDSRITYFVVINKEIENFSFSYFNLKQNKFLNIDIPIIVDDDSVTTQSDLKPTDQSRELLKIQIAGAVAFFIFLLLLWKRKLIYFIIMILPLIYIGFLLIPSKEICIKKGADIRLLPVSNGTIFKTTNAIEHFKKEGNVNKFIKIELQNEQIGWVKDEDICAP
jgi:hypothetical protein